MPTEDEMKQWIDGASYGQLLDRWRSAPAGEPIFQRPMGDYYKEVMDRKKAEVGPGAAVAASKAIG